jgi:hypothetical protein
LCPLHRRLDDAARLVERSFRDSSISQLLRQSASGAPLCKSTTLRVRGRARPGST